MDGLVIKNTGSWYVVHTDNGEDVNCKIKGNFRLKGIRTTNPVAVGDRVTISVNPDGNAFITAIQPRKNYIIRRASNLSKESHIIAANLDCAFLVVTLAHPVTSTTFIDRFLATAEAYRVPAVLLINKVDLLTDDEDKEYCEAVASLYRTIGYDVLEISALTGEGMTELRERLKDKISLFSGNSGVGKSTIINALLPDLDLRTGSISDMHDTGMHTTTFSEMFPLPEGGWIIDTPGIKGFGTIDFDKHEIAHFFPEIFKISADCKYGNCTHTHEPGCAVLKALDDHYISQSRYASYLSILDDTNPDKYRKPF
ncbi:ribosome small subunit-dependent GTPase A [uncultured Muribaculum sp.]|uniref:ribosome small subunit-dependent GTPase A n=1 Tax=uncultured Muribaculum sp. TaxID=1918613 RepID=UPI0025B0D08D|nr:ribosome small subunit-dependent GTPase A [uncultured Muribaculum sp.]